MIALLVALLGLAQAADPMKQPVRGWARVDVEGSGVGPTVWAGLTVPVARSPTALAADVRVTGRDVGVDVGLTRESGALYFMPLVGFTWDFDRFGTLVPQLVATVEVPPLGAYVETWTQVQVRSVLDDARPDTFYERVFVLVRLGRDVGLGPQFEVTTEVANTTGAATSLPLGLRLNLRPFEGAALGVFAGYELNESARRGLFGDEATGVVARGTATVRF